MKSKCARIAPKTEGIKYAGSKLKLLPHILELAARVNPKTVYDGFAGTTRVSQAFAKTGYRVISNDVAVWSETFARCYLTNQESANYYSGLIDHLNNLSGKDGWFTENYGGSADGEFSSDQDGLKKPFQIHNTRKLDAIRQEIDILDLGKNEKSVLLTSLILALDKVDSTIGHHASYLNRWSPRSYKKLELKLPLIFKSESAHEVLRSDVFEAAGRVEADLAYFDPPYGSNNARMPPSRVRYASYYHLWTSIILNDVPEIFGKAKRREDTRDLESGSVFEEFRQDPDGNFVAVEALRNLLADTRAKHIILSYSSGGRATAENLLEILNTSGKVIDTVAIDYRKNVMASMRWTNDWVRDATHKNKEYLFLIEK